MNHLELRYALLRLADMPSVRWVKLFGSRARGTHQPHSDYDLAVSLDDRTKADWGEIEEMVAEAVMLPVDVVDIDRASDDIQHTVKHIGICVYLRADWYMAFIRLAKAMASLADVINEPDDLKHQHRDSVIARFQYVFDLFWKLFKELAEVEGFKESSPRGAIARAFQQGWIDNEPLWQDMLLDRNKAAHSYNEALARQVYRNIQANYSELQKTYMITETHALSLMELTYA